MSTVKKELVENLITYLEDMTSTDKTLVPVFTAKDSKGHTTSLSAEFILTLLKTYNSTLL